MHARGIRALGLAAYSIPVETLHKPSFPRDRLSAGASAITAGMEWHKGLKARALNKLTVAVLVVASTAYMLVALTAH